MSSKIGTRDARRANPGFALSNAAVPVPMLIPVFDTTFRADVAEMQCRQGLVAKRPVAISALGRRVPAEVKHFSKRRNRKQSVPLPKLRGVSEHGIYGHCPNSAMLPSKGNFGGGTTIPLVAASEKGSAQTNCFMRLHQAA